MLLNRSIAHLFFLLLSSIPLHEHTTIYLSVDGHLSCLVVSEVSAIGVAAMNIYTKSFMWTHVFIHLRYLHLRYSVLQATPNSRMFKP